MTTLTEALAKARSAAGEIAASAPVPQNQLPASVPTAGAIQNTTHRESFSVEDLLTGTISVDVFAKVKDTGILLGDVQIPVMDFDVVIDMAEVQVGQAIKFGSNPAVYYKTYGGNICTSGGTWDQAVAKAQAVDPNATPYPTADIPAVLIANVVGYDAKAKKEVLVLEAGKRIGFTLSTTNKGNFASLIRSLQARQLPIKTGKVKVRIGHEHKQKGTNSWGLYTFTFVDVVEEEGPPPDAD